MNKISTLLSAFAMVNAGQKKARGGLGAVIKKTGSAGAVVHRKKRKIQKLSRKINRGRKNIHV